MNDENNKNESKKLSSLEKIKLFFKNPKEVIGFFLPIFFALICIIPVPYYVTIGGGTIPLNEKIEIIGETNSKGSLNSAYVKEVKGTVFTYLLSYVIPNYELTKVEDVVLENEDPKEYNFRERLYFANSLDSAVKVAFEALDKEVKVKKQILHIVYIDKEAENDLKVADQLLKVEGTPVKSVDELSIKLEELSYKEEIIITVLRDNKEINCSAKLILIEGNKKIGIVIATEFVYETDPEVKFHFSSNEQGPSGGLMLALSIYDKLSEEDITRGQKIVGTGTIELDGTVGEIGGVKYKLMGAVKANADLFLCPKENLEEALKVKEEKGYHIKIVGVATFNEALEVLGKE